MPGATRPAHLPGEREDECSSSEITSAGSLTCFAAVACCASRRATSKLHCESGSEQTLQNFYTHSSVNPEVTFHSQHQIHSR